MPREPMDEREKCPTCDGCGQVADDEDHTPWSEWLNLPVKSGAAVILGLVQPLPCPDCGGTGRQPAAPVERVSKPDWIDQAKREIEKLEREVFLGSRYEQATTSTEEGPSLTYDGLAQLYADLRKRTAIYYVLSPFVPVKNTDGQPALYHWADLDAWLLHPDNLPSFREEVGKFGYHSEPFDFQAHARRDLCKTTRCPGQSGLRCPGDPECPVFHPETRKEETQL